MFKSPNRRRHTRRSCCPALIQPLESRQLLAAAITDQSLNTLPEIQPAVMPTASGIVSVSISRAGDLSIAGDSNGNFVAVQFSVEGVTVSGWSTGTLVRINGQQPSDSVSVPLTNTSAIRSVSISLGGGDDTLRLQFKSDLTISRDLAVNLGPGADFIDIGLEQANLRISQDLLLDMAGGHDRGVINTWSTSTLVTGRDISIRGGAGDDTLFVHAHNTVAADQLSSPALFRQLIDNTATTQSQPVRARRDLLVDLGAGDDALTLLAAEAGRDGTISLGTGQDVVTASNLRSARSLRLSDAEAVALQNITAIIQLAVRGTAAADKLDLERITATRIDVDLAAGNDRLSLGETLTVRTFAVIEGGTGTNRISVGTPRFGFFYRRFNPTLTRPESLELLAGTLAASPQPTFSIMAEYTQHQPRNLH
ncbi:MAG: hypothetical protein ACK48U_07980 [Planctomyces sp.]